MRLRKIGTRAVENPEVPSQSENTAAQAKVMGKFQSNGYAKSGKLGRSMGNFHIERGVLASESSPLIFAES
jgi:hypothetical protein